MRTALCAYPRVVAVLSALLLAGTCPAPAAEAARDMPVDPATDFVTRDGTHLLLAGKPFRIAGVNNHYLPFGSKEEVIGVLDDAVAMGANVVRTFIQPVIGSLDGTVPTIWNWKSTSDASNLGVGGAYVLSWDPVSGGMAYNDGETGLQRMDFVLTEARRRNLRVIVAFLDFWGYTGGAQQMSAWYGSNDKYTFFAADTRTRRDYKAWVRHVLDRTNSITGRPYKDDPAVLAWELANEPDIHPAPLRLDWVTEMSAYVKSIDPAHLVATGHANMVDAFADLSPPAVDLGTWHGYPSYVGQTHAQFDDLIRRNCAQASRYGKPILLEEFGIPRSDPHQAASYETWLATLKSSDGCPGWVVWRLVSRQRNGDFPQDDHDQFDIRNDDSATWNVLRNAARQFR